MPPSHITNNLPLVASLLASQVNDLIIGEDGNASFVKHDEGRGHDTRDYWHGNDFEYDEEEEDPEAKEERIMKQLSGSGGHHLSPNDLKILKKTAGSGRDTIAIAKVKKRKKAEEGKEGGRRRESLKSLGKVDKEKAKRRASLKSL